MKYGRIVVSIPYAGLMLASSDMIRQGQADPNASYGTVSIPRQPGGLLW